LDVGAPRKEAEEVVEHVDARPGRDREVGRVERPPGRVVDLPGVDEELELRPAVDGEVEQVEVDLRVDVLTELEAREPDVARELLVDRHAAQRPASAEAELLLERDALARGLLLEADQQLDG